MHVHCQPRNSQPVHVNLCEIILREEEKRKEKKKKSVLNLWSKGTYTYVHVLVFHENVLS